jgi:murein DD-endopeptidase MepM/ murein hydrolase activator NlpD
LAAVFLFWGWLLVDRRTLTGISVAGVPVPRTSDPFGFLTAKASAWENQRIHLRVGNVETELHRVDLGARRPVAELADKMSRLGRTGNPFADLATFWSVTLYGRNFNWSIQIDRKVLNDLASAAREQIERPPVVGTIDDEGWSAPGIPGRTLNSVNAVALLEDALRRDRTSVQFSILDIAPPDPIRIGPPDAEMFGAQAESFTDTARNGQIARAEPPPGIVWAPSRGRECYPPDYDGRVHCQGPRRVPVPRGEAAWLARRLRLGDISYIGTLFYTRPDPAWVDQAGPAGPQTLLWPVPGGVFVRGYGYVRKGIMRWKIHKGIDIGAPVGTPILAMKDGIVAYADNTIRGYGNLLTIIHGDASVSNYAHCNAIYVFPGQRVRRGQVVAEIGNTGYSGGPHLHFEYRVDGRAIDPKPLLIEPKRNRPRLALLSFR